MLDKGFTDPGNMIILRFLAGRQNDRRVNQVPSSTFYVTHASECCGVLPSIVLPLVQNHTVPDIGTMIIVAIFLIAHHTLCTP